MVGLHRDLQVVLTDHAVQLAELEAMIGAADCSSRTGGYPCPGAANHDGDIEIWARPLANGDTAVALFNRSTQTTGIRTDVREIGAGHRPLRLVWDLWPKRPFVTTGELSTTVPAHGATLLLEDSPRLPPCRKHTR